MLVRSKITQAEAIQFTLKNREEIAEWLGDDYQTDGANNVLFIERGKNRLAMRKNDWLVRTESGGFLRFDSDEFHDLFEVVKK